MKILIVSYEAWRDTNNGGNVLSNMFEAFPDADLAQIYCSGELPQNSICQTYFQLSDSMLLTRNKGCRLETKDYSISAADRDGVIENTIKSKIPECLKNAALLARELLWTVVNWKSEGLEAFVKEFHPDIIFAPCYSFFHVSKLALHVKKIAGCPMISYISDDNYSLKRLTLSPSFWINRLITRKWIRRHFAECSLVYTMTEMQKKEYEALFHRPMKVLCKSAAFTEEEREVGDPIRLIYAGGLYLNRWKILTRLAKVLASVNEPQVKAQLHVYSGSKLSARNARGLHDGQNVFLHDPIPFEQLKEQYRASDIAVHVESFDLKNRLITRLSFSTKIIDCMNSGCAVLAIGPSSQAGISYLKENDGAVCVTDINDLASTIDRLVNQKASIREYAEKAKRLGRKNHIKEIVEKQIRQDFQDVLMGH